ncbi:MAG: T9SS type A sorting domain-containing protein [Bacteroidetes bacterium]|nr:T9SS type A sorting domain-containing protein [Bacteroidota bacterium]MBU1114572.1 T9SS type A sorting domain-containing protein [Bacteroidota bacterium]MBU1798801.1 T9SS type A sorting domain-containing protein [Bacteroidota bacterium]
MKPLLKIAFFTLLFILNNKIISQEYEIYKFAGTTRAVEYVVNEQANTGTFNASTIDYGYDETSIYGTTYKNRYYFRKAYKFNLTDIPSNAYNLTAYLEAYYGDWATGSAMIKVLTDNINYNDDAEVYNSVAAGSKLFTVDGESGTFNDYTALINSKRSQGYINLGCMLNENSYGKGNISLLLKITYDTPYSLTAKNDMSGYNGGNIGVGKNVSATSKTSPNTISDAYSGDNINLLAYENQSYGGYNWIWNAPEENEAPNNKSNWVKKVGGTVFTPFSSSQSASYPVISGDNGANLTGYLKKVCNLTFTNSFNGISEPGVIKVKDLTVSAPTAQYPIVDGNTIKVEAITQTFYDVKYTFSHWSDGNTQNPRFITANSTANFTAVYVGTPVFTNFYINNRNLHSNTYIQGQQQLVTLYWNQHQSSNVTAYKVRRGANINNVTTWNIIATVSSSTTSYTDSDFEIAASKSTGSIVMYDVKAYYSPDQTVSVNEAITVYANYAPIQKIANSDSTSTELPVINEYALNSNYPNPFNPTTQISYQIPENSFVNLVVYNALGQKVAELVNQEQTSGKYTVKFDASNLPSGVYIYKLQTEKFSDVKKMLLTK